MAAATLATANASCAFGSKTALGGDSGALGDGVQQGLGEGKAGATAEGHDDGGVKGEAGEATAANEGFKEKQNEAQGSQG